MLQYFRTVCVTLALAGVVNSVSGFSLIGPYDTWQTAELSYNPRGFDIGGPMNLGEEYRWNVKTVTYGFDASFMNYFGARGTAAVMQAVAILNALPSAAQMSSNLTEFPLQTKGLNSRASAVNLLDLKSYALATLLEEMGLASPERYVWTLRDRRVIQNIPYYVVVQRNFDPVTFSPSRYVNGTLYTYSVIDWNLSDGTQYWEASEIPVDPISSFSSVVTAVDGSSRIIGGILSYGQFFTGLTRDDVGGLRYIYRNSNWNTEDLLPDTGGGVPDRPPFGIPGNTVTNTPYGTALRKGVDKITFALMSNAGGYGPFLAYTNASKDEYFFATNGLAYWTNQNTVRYQTQPDILFTAEDLGLDAGGSPIGIRRSETAAWANGAAINGQAALAGPGVILPTVVIAFNKVGPFIYNWEESSLDESSGIWGFVWGWFDGTTNAPVVFPAGTTIEDLEAQITSSGF